MNRCYKKVLQGPFFLYIFYVLARKRVHGYGLMLTVNPSQVRSGSCKTQTRLTVSICAHVSKKSLLSSSHLSLW